MEIIISCRSVWEINKILWLSDLESSLRHKVKVTGFLSEGSRVEGRGSCMLHCNLAASIYFRKYWTFFRSRKSLASESAKIVYLVFLSLLIWFIDLIFLMCILVYERYDKELEKRYMYIRVQGLILILFMLVFLSFCRYWLKYFRSV